MYIDQPYGVKSPGLLDCCGLLFYGFAAFTISVCLFHDSLLFKILSYPFWVQSQHAQYKRKEILLIYAQILKDASFGRAQRQPVGE